MDADQATEAPGHPDGNSGSHVIQIEDRYYILATSSMADDRDRVLKHGDTFAVFDRYGDIQPLGHGEQGIYKAGTRHLSRLTFWLADDRPLLLSSTVLSDNTLLAIDMTNLDLRQDAHTVIPQDAVHLFRSKFLRDGRCYERLRITNYDEHPVRLPLTIWYEADFADIFEVRGARRARRGTYREPEISDDAVILSYEGLDGVVRRTRISCAPQPDRIDGSALHLTLEVLPGATETVFVLIACDDDPEAPTAYDDAYMGVLGTAYEETRSFCRVDSTNQPFNEWVARSVADLRMMTTTLPEGPYPFAGVPWFSAPFGRDGLLTAMQALWVKPDLARGVLTYLAASQSEVLDEENDAEPGKILHEARDGEMAALGEIPFKKYYGTVDATPLFVMLASDYYTATADAATIAAVWPNVERALAWIDASGDLDGDGFYEYERHSREGLSNQGWKDSADPVFHADGTQATGPIALAEVQGYVYAAKRGAAMLARAMEDMRLADRLERDAEDLRARFDDAFWCEDIGTYALALDGRKRPCKVRTSNAGHCLFTGIASEEHADIVAGTLLDDRSFSGWGVRTVASTEARFNPMSYHNGSVWPHDNALIAAGLARYGHRDLAMKILGGLFEASMVVDLHRLPELFCGFPRRPHEGPTLYPVACAPQSWASAAVFLLLGSALGLEVDALERQVRFRRTALPPFLDSVRISNLRCGTASLDVDFRREPTGVTVNVIAKEGDVDVIAIK